MKKNISFKLWVGNKYKTNYGYTIWLKVEKDRDRRIYSTGLSAYPHQWDRENECFISDKRTPKLHPDRVRNNEWLLMKKADIIRILREFEEKRIDWTVAQFEAAYFNYAARGMIGSFFTNLIKDMEDTGHFGNASVYIRTLHMLNLFDVDFYKRVFSEVDLKYVKRFDLFLEKRKCKGNTRYFYLKSLRSIYKKAIKEGEASNETYPFGENGLILNKLKEKTLHKFLPIHVMKKVIETPMEKFNLELGRRLFVFSYYCYGMAYIDMGYLRKENLVEYNNGLYIVYKRNKVKNYPNTPYISIRVTPEIRELLDWFSEKTILRDDFLLPIVSISGYEGKQLYSHLRNRYKKIYYYLKGLDKELKLNIDLACHMARHTMAQTLRTNYVPTGVIQQFLGHMHEETTEIYLSSFENPVIDMAAKKLYLTNSAETNEMATEFRETKNKRNHPDK